jgi:histidinol dehydrogenase
LRIVESTNGRAVEALLSPERTRDEVSDRRVASIVSDVRRRGDAALLQYARTLDRLSGGVEVSREEMRAAAADVPRPVRAALRTAARNIRAVARRQVPKPWRVQVTSGVSVEQRVVPLDRVGCYVPGGRYPLPSSLLMTAVPALAAGVREVVAVCPRPEPVVMAAALEAGVSRLFRLGGAHAIAALAYGTDSVPRVDKIVGPGNRWVAAAKVLVAPDCGIDFYAGPTEVLIVSSRGPSEWIAADLIAQAEHDPDARAVLITPSRNLASQVAAKVTARTPESGPARQSLHAHGGIIVTRSTREAMALANSAAPEHLVVDDEKLAAQARCAGSIFVGAWSALAAGDYAIGSNHVLPTAGAARVRGGLSAADFVRQITVQRLSRSGLSRIGRSVIELARAEGLTGHAESIVVRLDDAAGLKGRTRPASRKDGTRPTASTKATAVRRSSTRRRKGRTRPTR